MKHPQYQPGARWQVRRPDKSSYDFDFVIIGPGTKPDRKLCRVEYLQPSQRTVNFECEYTHKHLKKHSVYVPALPPDKGCHSDEHDQPEAIFGDPNQERADLGAHKTLSDDAFDALTKDLQESE